MIKQRGIILHILTKPRGIALMTPHEMTFEHVAEAAAVEVVLHVGELVLAVFLVGGEDFHGVEIAEIAVAVESLDELETKVTERGIACHILGMSCGKHVFYSKTLGIFLEQLVELEHEALPPVRRQHHALPYLGTAVGEDVSHFWLRGIGSYIMKKAAGGYQFVLVEESIYDVGTAFDEGVFVFFGCHGDKKILTWKVCHDDLAHLLMQRTVGWKEAT